MKLVGKARENDLDDFNHHTHVLKFRNVQSSGIVYFNLKKGFSKLSKY